MSEVIEHAHSDLGPSAADRWLGCPWSVLGTKDLPGVPTEYAAEGVFAHTVSEWARLENKPVSAFKGRELEIDGFKFKVGKAAIEHIQTFVDSCAAIPGASYFEERVHYDYWVPGGFGTADDIRIEDGVCTVTDLKYGTGLKVFAKNNPQLRLYAVGAFVKYGWLFEFDKFVLRICQPRLRHFEEETVSLGELMRWMYDVIRPGAKLAMTPGAPIVAGSWCKFCKIRNTCVVRADYKMAMRNREVNAETEFEDMT